jgi:hypothetical protein
MFFIHSQAFAFFVPDDAYTFDFNIDTVKMGRLKERKLDQAVDLLREVFASPEFKQKILNHKFRGRRTFYMNKGLSNAEIYRRILSGVERIYPYRNNAMDVEVELYSDFQSTVIGFTRPGTKRIWMNSKYFNKHTHAELAAHLMHEWLHKLGFDHEQERTPDRRFSVPYAIGYIVKDVAKKLSISKH